MQQMTQEVTMMWQTSKSGFTLTELIIVILIIITVYSISLPTFTRYNQNKKLEQAAKLVEEVLQAAKSYSITNREKGEFVLSTTNNTFFYREEGALNHLDKIYDLASGLQFAGSSATNIVFNTNGTLDSAAANFERVTIQSAQGATKNIDTNVRTGKVTIS